MRFAKTVSVLTCVVLVFLTAARGYCGEEQPKQSTDDKAAKKAAAAEQQPKATAKKRKSKGRLPNNYGKLGLSDEQRQKVYGIQEKYRTQLEELQKQIKALTAKRDEEVEGVLTDSQKQELAKLLEASKKKRESRKKPKAAKPEPAKTSK